MNYFTRAIFAAVVMAASSTALAENLSGPRIGLTYLSQDTRTYASKKGVNLSGAISQFGWQFEQSFFTTRDGPQGVTALVPLLGGADQGVLLPSISWVTGMRSSHGYEFAVGPNVSVSGVGFVVVLGQTTRYGDVNFPVNASLVTSDNGVRLSLLVGFNSADGK